MRIFYEWACLEMDGDGEDAEIIDSNHYDKLEDAKWLASRHEHARIELVCHFYQDEVLQDRAWATMRPDGTMPEWLLDGSQNEVRRVPKRFHAEAARANRAKAVAP